MGTNTHIHPSNNGGTTNNEAKVQDNVLKILPPGYKFCPSDVELIEYYLKRKIAGDPNITHGRIHDVDVYKHSPDQLDGYIPTFIFIIFYFNLYTHTYMCVCVCVCFL